MVTTCHYIYYMSRRSSPQEWSPPLGEGAREALTRVDDGRRSEVEAEAKAQAMTARRCFVTREHVENAVLDLSDTSQNLDKVTSGAIV